MYIVIAIARVECGISKRHSHNNPCIYLAWMAVSVNIHTLHTQLDSMLGIILYCDIKYVAVVFSDIIASVKLSS